jgi:hypothetical protein
MDSARRKFTPLEWRIASRAIHRNLVQHKDPTGGVTPIDDIWKVASKRAWMKSAMGLILISLLPIAAAA